MMKTKHKYTKQKFLFVTKNPHKFFLGNDNALIRVKKRDVNFKGN